MADDGVECPNCSCRHCKVLKTTYKTVAWGGKKRIHTRRTRECQRCYRTFHTVETYEDNRNIGFPDRSALPPEKQPPILPSKDVNPYLKEDNLKIVRPDEDEPRRKSL